MHVDNALGGHDEAQNKAQDGEAEAEDADSFLLFGDAVYSMREETLCRYYNMSSVRVNEWVKKKVQTPVRVRTWTRTVTRVSVAALADSEYEFISALFHRVTVS